MDKQTIYFKAGEDQELKLISGLKTFAIETINYIEAHFELPDSWKTFTELYAVWFIENKQKGSLIDENGVTVIPSEMLKRPGTLEVNLCGNDLEEGKLVGCWTSYPTDALKLKHTKI